MCGGRDVEDHCVQQEHEAADARENAPPTAGREPVDGLERPRSALGLGAFLLILVAALLAAGAVWWKASHPWVDPVDPRAADPMHAIGARG